MQTAAGVGALLGRDVELALLRAFLERRPEDGAAALLLEGEAGIGKTAMWQATTEAAHERGFRVLRARPSEAERTLSFAALADLLGDAHELIEQLPPVQRRPLAVALLLEEADGPAPDRRAIGVALLATLRTLAEERPLLLCIDDIQWIDPPTAAALAFALRRLADQPLCVVMAERAASDAALGHEVARALPCERLALGPLSLGAVGWLLQERLDSTFPRPILRRIYDHSGGNPFFALELARALRSRDAVLSPADELPVPDDLERLLAERLERLPAETREPLAAVAALAEPTLEVVPEESLAPAVADGGLG